MAEERKLALENVENYKAVQGQGLTATLGREEVAVGNLRLIKSVLSLDENTLKTAEKAAEGNPTVLFVACGGKLKGYFVVEDTVTEQAKKAVNEFKAMKMKVVMLTGDNELAAKKVADELGIDYKAGVLPQDKCAEVVRYTESGRKTLMVGDGVNDAPALTAAYVGMAIGAGTDIAIESADAVLIKNDLRDAVGAVRLGKAVMRNVKENLFWAFFYNAVLIPLACGVLYIPFNVLMNPMYGSAAMSLSSVSVVLNALRLNLVKLGNNKTENKKSEARVMKENKTIVYIDGMMCDHCKKRVTEAFKSIGITADVDVKKKRATFGEANASDEEIKSAIEAAGYTVKKIER